MIRRALLGLLALFMLALPASAAAGWWTYESGAWKSVTVPRVWEGGAYKAVNNGWVWEGGAWHLFFTSLAVSASDVSGITSINVGGCAVPETGIPGTTVTGGSGSFTYLWTFVSGDGPPSTDPNATVQNPKWFQSLCTGSGGDVTSDSVWHVLVTDTVTSSTVGTSINVHLEYNRP